MPDPQWLLDFRQNGTSNPVQPFVVGTAPRFDSPWERYKFYRDEDPGWSMPSISSTVYTGVSAPVPEVTPKESEDSEEKGAWSRFWNKPLGWEPPWADHQQEVKETIEGIDPEVLKQVSSPSAITRDILAYAGYGGLVESFDRLTGKDVRPVISPVVDSFLEARKRREAGREAGLSNEQMKAIAFHDLAYSEHAQTRNLIAGGVAGAAAAVVAAPAVAAGVAAAGVTGASAFVANALAAGAIGSAFSVVPELIEIGSPYGSGGSEITPQEAGWASLGLFGDLGFGAAAAGARPTIKSVAGGTRSVTQPIGRGLSKVFRPVTQPIGRGLSKVFRPVTQPIGRGLSGAFRPARSGLEWAREQATRRLATQGLKAIEVPASSRAVTSEEQYREEVASTLEGWRTGVDDSDRIVSESDFTFNPTERYVPPGSEPGVTGITAYQYAEHLLQSRYAYTPDISDVEVSQYAEEVANWAYLRRGQTVAEEEHAAVVGRAKDVIRAVVPEELDNIDTTEAATQFLRDRIDQAGLYAERIREAGFLDEADAYERGTRLVEDNFSEAVRTERSRMYTQERAVWVQEQEEALIGRPQAYRSQIDDMLSDIMPDEANREAFYKGVVGGDIGISGIMTRQGVYTPEGFINPMAETPLGGFEGLGFDPAFTGEDTFGGVVTFSGRQRDLPYFNRWLQDTGLHVAGGGGKGPGSEIALYLTNRADASADFYSMWKTLGLSEEQIKGDMFDLFGKRFGSMRATDLSYMAPASYTPETVTDVVDAGGVRSMQFASGEHTIGFIPERPTYSLIDTLEDNREIFVTKGTDAYTEYFDETTGDLLAPERYTLDAGAAVDRADAGGLVSESWFRQFARDEFKAKGSTWDDAAIDEYVSDLIGEGDFAFALTSTFGDAISKADYQVVSDAMYQERAMELVSDLGLAGDAELPSMITSAASLKRGGEEGYTFSRQTHRMIFKPSYHTENIHNYLVGNVTQYSPFAESYLGPELYLDQVREGYKGLSEESLAQLSKSLDQAQTRRAVTAARAAYQLEQPSRIADRKAYAAHDSMRRSYEAFQEKYQGADYQPFPEFESQFVPVDEEEIMESFARAEYESSLGVEEYTKRHQLFMREAYERSGPQASTLLPFFDSPVEQVITRGGVGRAPSTIMEGVQGRYLPGGLFASPEDSDFVKLIFDDNMQGDKVYRGFTAHAEDAASREFRRGGETADADDHFVQNLLYTENKEAGVRQYYMPLARSPIGGWGGMVRRVSPEDAEEFMRVTGVDSIDVTDATLKSGNKWNFEEVRAGLSEGRPAYAADLHTRYDDPDAYAFGEAAPVKYDSDPERMLRMWVNANEDKGSIGVLDSVMRLLRDSGSDSPLLGTIFSDALDVVTRFKGSIKPGINMFLDAVVDHADKDTLDRHTLDQYPWLEGMVQRHMAEKNANVGIRWEYKRGPQAAAREEGLEYMDLLHSLRSATTMGPQKALVDEDIPDGLRELATDTVQRVSGLHRYYTAEEFSDTIDKPMLYEQKRKVVEDAYTSSIDAGYIDDTNKEKFGAALAQASMIESTLSGRTGVRSRVSMEVLADLPRDVYTEYFDKYGKAEASLRYSFEDFEGAKPLELNRETPVEYRIDKIDKDYFVGKDEGGVFIPYQKITDPEMGAVGSQARNILYEGMVDATTKRPDVADVAIFSIQPSQFGEADSVSRDTQWFDSLRSITDDLIRAHPEEIDWNRIGVGKQNPEGILRTRSRGSFSEAGQYMSVQGGFGQALTPREVSEHVDNPGTNTMVMDIESSYSSAFRNVAARTGVNTDRDDVTVAYFRAITDKPVVWTDAMGEEHMGRDIAIPFDELRGETLSDIFDQVTDIAGYNVSFDMDIIGRKFGIDFTDKYVLDVQQGADLMGMGDRSRIKLLTDHADPADVWKADTIENVSWNPYGPSPVGIGLKGEPHSVAEQMDVHLREGVEDINALRLARAHISNPTDPRYRAALDLYGGADVEETARLLKVQRAALEEQMTGGDFDDWGDVTPLYYRYHQTPDPMDAPRRRGVGQNIKPVFDIHADDTDPVELLNEIKQQGRRGRGGVFRDYYSEENRPLISRSPLAEAWAQRTMGSGLPGVGSLALRGMHGMGNVLSRGAGRLGRGIGTGLRYAGERTRFNQAAGNLLDTAATRFIGGAAKGPFTTRGGQEVGMDVREALKSWSTQAVVGNEAIGQWARVFMLPGMYQRSNLEAGSLAASVGTAGAPWTAAWLSSGRGLGKLWSSPSDARRFAAVKSADLTKSNIGESLREIEEGADPSEIYSGLMQGISGETDQVKLRVLRDRGDLNPLLRRIHETVGGAEDTELAKEYGQFKDKLTGLGGNPSALYMREHEGLAEYGNFATITLRDWKQRGLRKLGFEQPDYKILSEAKQAELSRESGYLLDLARMGGVTRDDVASVTEVQGASIKLSGAESIVAKELPMPYIPRDWFRDPQIASRWTDRGLRPGEAQFDVARDWDLLSRPEMRRRLELNEDEAAKWRENVTRVAQRREALIRDLPRTPHLGRMDYTQRDIGESFKSGVSLKDIGSTLYGRYVGIGSTDGRGWLRRRGGPTDLREWGKLRRPWEGVAKPVLSAFILGSTGVVAGKSAHAMYDLKQEFPEYVEEHGYGFNIDDLTSSQYPRASDRMQTYSSRGASRSFPLGPFNALPSFRPLEFLGGPVRQYARAHNEAVEAGEKEGELMNEEWSSGLMAGLTSPWAHHIYQFERASYIPPSRWKEDIGRTIPGIFNSQQEGFSRMFKEQEWGELSSEERESITSPIEPVDWDRLKAGEFDAAGGSAGFRSQIAGLRGQYEDDDDWNQLVGDLEAYEGYYQTAAAKDLAPWFARKVLDDDWRKIGAMGTAHGLRGDVIEQAGENRADSVKAVFDSLQFVNRAQYGEAFKYDDSDWERKWREGEIKPMAARDYEYNFADYAGQWVQEQDLMDPDKKLSTWERFKERTNTWFQPWKPDVVYYGPSEKGSGWMKIPEVADVPEPVSRMPEFNNSVVVAGDVMSSVGRVTAEESLDKPWLWQHPSSDYITKGNPSLAQWHSIRVPSLNAEAGSLHSALSRNMEAMKLQDVTHGEPEYFAQDGLAVENSGRMVRQWPAGGVNVKVGEGGRDEAVIPLDKSVFADLFGTDSDSLSGADTQALLEIARNLHEVAMTIGKVEIVLDGMTHTIDDSGKGMKSAVQAVADLQQKTQAGYAFSEGDEVRMPEWAGGSDSVSILQSGSPYSEGSGLRRIFEEAIGEIKADWNPFSGPSETVQSWMADPSQATTQWGRTKAQFGVYEPADREGFITEYSRSADRLGIADPTFMPGVPAADAMSGSLLEDTPGSIFYPPDIIAGNLQDMAKFEAERIEEGRNVLKSSGDLRTMADGELRPVDQLAKEGLLDSAFELGTYRFDEDRLFIDNADPDSIRVRTETPLIIDGTKHSESVLYDESTAEARALRDKAIEIGTAELRFAGFDAPEYDEVSSLYAEAITRKFQTDAGTGARYTVEGVDATGERLLTDVSAIDAGGQEHSLAELQVALGTSRYTGGGVARGVLQDYVDREGIGITGGVFQMFGLGTDADIRGMSKADRELANITFAKSDEGRRSLERTMGFSLSDDQIGELEQTGTLANITPSMFEAVPSRVTTASDAVAQLLDMPDGVDKYFAQGMPDWSSIRDAVAATEGQVVGEELAVLGTLYEDSASGEELRGKYLSNQDVRKEVRAIESGVFRKMSQYEGLEYEPMHILPDVVADQLGDPEYMGGMAVNSLDVQHIQEQLMQTQADMFKQFDAQLDQFAGGFGVSTDDPLFRQSVMTATGQTNREEREFYELNAGELSEAQFDYSEALFANLENVLVNSITEQTQRLVEVQTQRTELEEADVALRTVGSYFDPYATAVTKDQIEAAMPDATDPMSSIINVAGEISDFSSGTDLYGHLMRSAEAERQLREENDGAGWRLVEMLDHDKYFGEGQVDSLATKARIQYGVANELDTEGWGAFEGPQQAWEQAQKEFEGILTAPMMEDVQLELDLGNIENQSQLIEEIFKTLFGSIYDLGKETSATLKAEFDSVAALKEANKSIDVVASYFDPYASKASQSRIDTMMPGPNDPMSSIINVAADIGGFGSGSDLFGFMMQSAEAERELREENDGAGWRLIEMLDQDKHFGSGLVDSLATRASIQYGQANELDTEGWGVFGGPDQAWAQAQRDFTGILTQPMMDDVQLELDLGNIESQSQLIEEIFKSLFSSIHDLGKEASDTLKSEFDNVQLQRNAAGGVEARSHLSNLPRGFVDALLEMGKSGSRISVPGSRSGQESDRAVEIDPKSGRRRTGTGVWETGGTTYRLIGSEEDDTQQIVVEEKVTRNVEQRRVGDKWYTYINGEWDGKEGQADKDPNQPTGIVHGIIKSTYDLDGSLRRQTERFQKEPDGNWGEEVELYLGKLPATGDGASTDGSGGASSFDWAGWIEENFADLSEEDKLGLLADILASGVTVDGIIEWNEWINTHLGDLTSEQKMELLKKRLGSDWTDEEVISWAQWVKDNLSVTDAERSELIQKGLGVGWTDDEVISWAQWVKDNLSVTDSERKELIEKGLGVGWTDEEVISWAQWVKDNLSVTDEERKELIQRGLGVGWTDEEVINWAQWVTDNLTLTDSERSELIQKGLGVGWTDEEVISWAQWVKDNLTISDSEKSELIQRGLGHSWTSEELISWAQWVKDNLTLTDSERSELIQKGLGYSWSSEELINWAEWVDKNLSLTDEQKMHLLAYGLGHEWSSEERINWAEWVSKQFDLTPEQQFLLLQAGFGFGWSSDELIKWGDWVNANLDLTAEQKMNLLMWIMGPLDVGESIDWMQWLTDNLSLTDAQAAELLIKLLGIGAVGEESGIDVESLRTFLKEQVENGAKLADIPGLVRAWVESVLVGEMDIAGDYAATGGLGNSNSEGTTNRRSVSGTGATFEQAHPEYSNDYTSDRATSAEGSAGGLGATVQNIVVGKVTEAAEKIPNMLYAALGLDPEGSGGDTGELDKAFSGLVEAINTSASNFLSMFGVGGEGDSSSSSSSSSSISTEIEGLSTAIGKIGTALGEILTAVEKVDASKVKFSGVETKIGELVSALAGIIRSLGVGAGSSISHANLSMQIKGVSDSVGELLKASNTLRGALEGDLNSGSIVTTINAAITSSGEVETALNNLKLGIGESTLEAAAVTTSIQNIITESNNIVNALLAVLAAIRASGEDSGLAKGAIATKLQSIVTESENVVNALLAVLGAIGADSALAKGAIATKLQSILTEGQNVVLSLQAVLGVIGADSAPAKDAVVTELNSILTESGKVVSALGEVLKVIGEATIGDEEGAKNIAQMLTSILTESGKVVSALEEVLKVIGEATIGDEEGAKNIAQMLTSILMESGKVVSALGEVLKVIGEATIGEDDDAKNIAQMLTSILTESNNVVKALREVLKVIGKASLGEEEDAKNIAQLLTAILAQQGEILKRLTTVLDTILGDIDAVTVTKTVATWLTEIETSLKNIEEAAQKLEDDIGTVDNVDIAGAISSLDGAIRAAAAAASRLQTRLDNAGVDGVGDGTTSTPPQQTPPQQTPPEQTPPEQTPPEQDPPAQQVSVDPATVEAAQQSAAAAQELAGSVGDYVIAAQAVLNFIPEASKAEAQTIVDAIVGAGQQTSALVAAALSAAEAAASATTQDAATAAQSKAESSVTGLGSLVSVIQGLLGQLDALIPSGGEGYDSEGYVEATFSGDFSATGGTGHSFEVSGVSGQEGIGNTQGELSGAIQNAINAADQVSQGLEEESKRIGVSDGGEEGDSGAGTVSESIEVINEKGETVIVSLESINAAIGASNEEGEGDRGTGTVAGGIEGINEKGETVIVSLESINAAIGASDAGGEGEGEGEVGTVSEGIDAIKGKQSDVKEGLEAVEKAIGATGGEGEAEGEGGGEGEGESGTVVEGIDAIKGKESDVKEGLEAVEKAIGATGGGEGEAEGEGGEGEGEGVSGTVMEGIGAIIKAEDVTVGALETVLKAIGEAATETNVAAEIKEILSSEKSALEKLADINEVLGTTVPESMTGIISAANALAARINSAAITASENGENSVTITVTVGGGTTGSTASTGGTGPTAPSTNPVADPTTDPTPVTNPTPGTDPATDPAGTGTTSTSSTPVFPTTQAEFDAMDSDTQRSVINSFNYGEATQEQRKFWAGRRTDKAYMLRKVFGLPVSLNYKDSDDGSFLGAKWLEELGLTTSSVTSANKYTRTIVSAIQAGESSVTVAGKTIQLNNDAGKRRSARLHAEREAWKVTEWEGTGEAVPAMTYSTHEDPLVAVSQNRRAQRAHAQAIAKSTGKVVRLDQFDDVMFIRPDGRVIKHSSDENFGYVYEKYDVIRYTGEALEAVKGTESPTSTGESGEGETESEEPTTHITTSEARTDAISFYKRKLTEAWVSPIKEEGKEKTDAEQRVGREVGYLMERMVNWGEVEPTSYRRQVGVLLENLGVSTEPEELVYGAWRGGFAEPTTGGVPLLVAERGEGEAILPISKVPQIFADTLKKVGPSLKDIAAAINGGGGNFNAMLDSMRGMEMAMVGVTDSHMDSVNSDGDSRIMIENHVTLEVDGEELANMIIQGEEISRRQGRR